MQTRVPQRLPERRANADSLDHLAGGELTTSKRWCQGGENSLHRSALSRFALGVSLRRYSMGVCCMEHESSGLRCTLVPNPKADILNLEELQHAPYPSLHRFLSLDRIHCGASVAYGGPGTSRGPRSDPGLR